MKKLQNGLYPFIHMDYRLITQKLEKLEKGPFRSRPDRKKLKSHNQRDF